MLVRKCLYLAPATFILYPRKVMALNDTTPVRMASYRERFEKMDKDDNTLVYNNYKSDLIKKFGHTEIISRLDNALIDDLHYMLVLYNKPLNPENRISIRRKILPLLETGDEETVRFFEYYLKYYDVL